MASVNAVIGFKLRFRRSLLVYNFARHILGLNVHIPRFAVKFSRPYFKPVVKNNG